MPTIPIDQLRSHPANANRMSAAGLDQLVAHIQRSDRYPALIVRPHPSEAGAYELLDGHHRLEALRKLRRAEARCEVWEVNDDQAAMLLLTLNRLRGQDDPARRGALLERLVGTMELKDLLRLVPDGSEQVRRLIACSRPPADESLAPPPDMRDMPQAVTFFLTAAQRARLLRRLREAHEDRSAALVAVLDLDDESSSVSVAS